jgi:ferredoxin--NADP+ reductase
MIAWDPQSYNVEIILENKLIAPYAYLLKFKRKFNFIAGQVVGLGIDKELEPRLYSIASGENDEFIEILYTEKPDGKLTPMLSMLRPGDSLLVTKPFGSYTDCPDSPFWIATGTGIAPFISMLKSGKGKHATLIHGVRTLEYFYFSDFLKVNLANSYIQCCSSNCETTIYNGRVTDYLKVQSLNPSKKYYLCGVAEMVVETRDLLISKGVPFNNIIAEIYF